MKTNTEAIKLAEALLTSLKEPDVPWTLPDPPPGMEWHRTDWTQDMLPDGWRPLLDGEHNLVGDEIKRGHRWETFGACADDMLNLPTTRVTSHCRTRRLLPLPLPHRWHAVREAHAAGKKVEWRYGKTGDWYPWKPSKQEVEENTNCSDFEFRISPEPAIVPWTRETCPPLPFEVRNKSGDRFTVATAREVGYNLVGDAAHYNWQVLLDLFVLPNGAPCGTEAK